MIVSYVLDNARFPDNFAILFLLAFMVMMVSYIFLYMLKEKEPNQAEEQFNNREYLKKLIVIIKNEPDFRNFLIANALLISALMADAFYTINALEKFSLTEGYAGQFTMVMMISMVVGNLIFGQLADRIGHKLNLTIAGIIVFCICLLAILASNVQVYYLVFVGAALTISLIHVSKFAIVAELCRENNRAIYVALTNMITSPFILLGILGGIIAEKFGYDLVFSIAGFFALLSAFWWLIKVPEPRRKSSSRITQISTD
jgi:MFS family permease